MKYYRELLEKFVDIYFYKNLYFVYTKGKMIPSGNEPDDFSMFPIDELYLKIDENTGLIENSNIKPCSYYIIENYKRLNKCK